MDRETIIRILKDNSFGTLNMDDVIKVVTSFIIDSGRTEKQAHDFVHSVLSHPMELGDMIIQCYNTALQHYERKFTICKLYSAPNIMALRGQERTLLSIF